MNDEIKKLLKSIYDSWFGATSKPKTSFTTHTINELEKAGYEIVKKDHWQPIETAPKELGHDIMLYVPNPIKDDKPICIIADWCDGWRIGTMEGDNIYTKEIPTHWQPLPEPPKE